MKKQLFSIILAVSLLCQSPVEAGSLQGAWSTVNTFVSSFFNRFAQNAAVSPSIPSVVPTEIRVATPASTTLASYMPAIVNRAINAISASHSLQAGLVGAGVMLTTGVVLKIRSIRARNAALNAAIRAADVAINDTGEASTLTLDDLRTHFNALYLAQETLAAINVSGYASKQAALARLTTKKESVQKALNKYNDLVDLLRQKDEQVRQMNDKYEGLNLRNKETNELEQIRSKVAQLEADIKNISFGQFSQEFKSDVIITLKHLNRQVKENEINAVLAERTREEQAKKTASLRKKLPTSPQKLQAVQQICTGATNLETKTLAELKDLKDRLPEAVDSFTQTYNPGTDHTYLSPDQMEFLNSDRPATVLRQVKELITQKSVSQSTL